MIRIRFELSVSAVRIETGRRLKTQKFKAETQGTDVSHFNEEPAILKARNLSDNEVLLLGK